MNSWLMLLVIDMNRGRYLGQRQPTGYEWAHLWVLIQDMEQARVTE